MDAIANFNEAAPLAPLRDFAACGRRAAARAWFASIVPCVRSDDAPRQPPNSDRLRAIGWARTIGMRDDVADAYAWLLERRAA
jgi:hypothetical protein